MPPRIQVIGSLNVDFTTVTPRFPDPGETLTATSLTFNAGGKGANQCVACGRASFTSKDEHDVDVEMIGAVGEGDPYYTSLLKPMLEEAGVDCTGIKQVKGSQTGTATIIVDSGHGGENRILVVPGANHDGMSNVGEVMQRASSKKTTPDVVVMQGELPERTVLNLLVQIGDNASIVFNPSPVSPAGIPGDLWGSIKVLIMNETEVRQVIANTADFRDFSLLGGGHGELNPSDLDRFACKIRRNGIKITIITRGSRGSYYWTATGAIQAVSATPVASVVDTTGAGDTFVGYFCVALARHLFNNPGQFDTFDVGAAISRASEQAAKCVQKAGAMQSIPWGYE